MYYNTTIELEIKLNKNHFNYKNCSKKKVFGITVKCGKKDGILFYNKSIKSLLNDIIEQQLDQQSKTPQAQKVKANITSLLKRALQDRPYEITNCTVVNELVGTSKN
jgi:hypothetical protein